MGDTPVGAAILDTTTERKRGSMGDMREDRVALFSKLERPDLQPQFWARVADDVDWMVQGTHPLAGHYHSKQQFVAATFSRLAGVLRGGVALKVQHVYVDGDTTIAELVSTSTTNEGATFANTYCWVCRFDGDTIVQVRAYVDSAMVAYTVLRNEGEHEGNGQSTWDAASN